MGGECTRRAPRERCWRRQARASLIMASFALSWRTALSARHVTRDYTLRQQRPSRAALDRQEFTRALKRDLRNAKETYLHAKRDLESRKPPSLSPAWFDPICGECLGVFPGVTAPNTSYPCQHGAGEGEGKARARGGRG